MSGTMLEVRQPSDAPWAREQIVAFAEQLGFQGLQRGRIAIAVTELLTNVVKFAGCGTVRFTAIAEAERRGLEVVVEDSGPGIDSIALAMRDGYSEGRMLDDDAPRRPGQGLGGGLGAVRRLMDDLSIDSSPGKGTRVVARKWL